jgi:hypothetical protein
MLPILRIIGADDSKNQTPCVSAHYPCIITPQTALISIPPHSSTRNNLRSCPRAASAPTTSVQDTVSSTADVSALADCQCSTSAEATPRKSMNTRVTTSGVGETTIDAACSYGSCGRNRSATCLCFSKSVSQYLNSHRISRRFNTLSSE